MTLLWYRIGPSAAGRNAKQLLEKLATGAIGVSDNESSTGDGHLVRERWTSSRNVEGLFISAAGYGPNGAHVAPVL